jgi:hypothetical protein
VWIEESPLWAEAGTMFLILLDQWVLVKFGLHQSFCRSQSLYLFDRSNLLVLVMYVDDLILTGNSKKLMAVQR